MYYPMTQFRTCTIHVVIQFPRYIIEDVSEDDDHSGDFSKRLKYSATASQLLMICLDDDAAVRKKMFQIGDQVIGLFPNTTCLYNATVASIPSRKKKIFEYQLQFESDDVDGQVPWRIVPARFVLERPQNLHHPHFKHSKGGC